MEPLLFGRGGPRPHCYRADTGKELDTRAMGRLGRPGPGAPERDGEARAAGTGEHTPEAGGGHAWASDNTGCPLQAGYRASMC